MSTFELNNINFKSFLRMIPDELWDFIERGRFKVVGAKFFDEPAGAAVYEETDGEMIILKSIYVAPEYRRLGIGTEIIEALRDKKFVFSYEAIDDRTSLEPFFEAVDVITNRIDIPLGEFTYSEMINALKKNKVKINKLKGEHYKDLTRKDKVIVEKWIYNEYGEMTNFGNVYDESSVFYIQDGIVEGAIILHKELPSVYDIIVTGVESEPRDLWFLDYVYNGTSKYSVLFGMINKVIKGNMDNMEADDVIQAHLSTNNGLELYRSFFGEPSVYIPLIYSGRV